MTESKTPGPEAPGLDATPQTPRGAAPVGDPRKSGPSSLVYLNFFMALVALVVLAGILLDPGYLVPDGLKGRLNSVAETTVRNTQDLATVRGRLDKLEQGGDLRALLEQAQVDEVVRIMRDLAARTKDLEREAALEAALKALGETP